MLCSKSKFGQGRGWPAHTALPVYCIDQLNPPPEADIPHGYALGRSVHQYDNPRCEQAENKKRTWTVASDLRTLPIRSVSLRDLSNLQSGGY